MSPNSEDSKRAKGTSAKRRTAPAATQLEGQRGSSSLQRRAQEGGAEEAWVKGLSSTSPRTWLRRARHDDGCTVGVKK